jgi:hypothetical protein
MTPGVTHFPAASMISASAGAVTAGPTAAILPSRSRMDPRSIAGPLAVRIVALQISIVREGKGLYVEMKGLGVDAEPVCGVADCGGFAGRCGVSGGVDVRSAGVVGPGAPGRGVCRAAEDCCARTIDIDPIIASAAIAAHMNR